MSKIKRILKRVVMVTVAGIAACVFPLHILAQDLQAPNPSLVSQPDVDTTDSNGFGNEVRALLVPHRQAMISSLVAARTQAIHVQVGDSFKEGDVLISFACDVLAAGIRSALAKQKQYQITHNANVELRKDDAVSKLDVALSEARLEESRANVALARAQQQRCTVVAPYNGKVAKVTVNEYESVEIGSPLIAILDDSQLEMTLHLPSSWVTSVTKGMKFNVSIDETEKRYDASVVRLSPEIDPTSRTFEITARVVGKQDDLLSGMSGNAHFDLVQ